MVDQMAEVDGKGAFIVEVEGKAEDEVAEWGAFVCRNKNSSKFHAEGFAVAWEEARGMDV